MARYINEDEFIAWVKEHWCADCQNYNGLRCRACWIDDAIDIVEEAPASDVVPKSEYEWVVSAVDNSTKEFLKLHDAYQEQKAENERLEEINERDVENIKLAKAEAAREIFEEIEKKVKASLVIHLEELNKEYIIDTPLYDRHSGILFALQGMDDFIAKLKKKYTEDQT